MATQNAALCPQPFLQFSDANGVPLAGGGVTTYAAGTTTLLATYTDATAAFANPNPVVLDAGGFARIWLGQAAYKIVVADLNGVVIQTVDNVSGLAPWYVNQAPTLWVTGNGALSGPGAFVMWNLAAGGESDFLTYGAGASPGTHRSGASRARRS
jgi:hypothetical protein